MSDSFETYAQHIAGGRSKRDRPLANNTRAYYIDDDTIGIKLHATDVVIYHRDGRIQVNSGGWRTITTADRIRSYSPVRLHSESGIWYVDLRPNPADPKPERPRRSVMKPFHALDPGPEPIKSDEGCMAGTEVVAIESREVYIHEHECRDDDVTLEHLTGYFSSRVQRNVTVVTQYRAERYQQSYPHLPFEHEGDEPKREQCPHCAFFDRQHDAWDFAMNGERWGRNPHRGYRQMTEALERYGSHEAWHDAYLADFRQVREGRRQYREWVDRNRVMFEDMMEVDADGYATSTLFDQTETLAAIERQRERINKFVRLAVDKLRAGMEMPSGGDCWYCCLSQVSDGTPMGDAMPTLHEDGSVTIQPAYHHLESHIDDEYVVPSMLINAMRERGYKDVGIYLHMDMNPDEQWMGGRGDYYKSVGDALRRYLMTRLLPQVAGGSNLAYKR